MFDDVDEIPRLTYAPGRLEADWLIRFLLGWFEDGTLTDVLFAVRGGKEANVYCCRGGPSTGRALIAAKVYRPRKLRELSNDAIYREGRGLIDDQGHATKARDRRMARAIRKGTRRGKQSAHTSWVMHEYAALCALYDRGASVPEPFAANDNAVLAAFVGDEQGAAPTMERLRFAPDLAHRLLDEALRNVELMLEAGWVHGDLSPYNMLLWRDRPVLIDFPQVVDALRNPHAPRLFHRDVARVCEGFRASGIDRDPTETAHAIWDRVFDTHTGVPDFLPR